MQDYNGYTSYLPSFSVVLLLAGVLLVSVLFRRALITVPEGNAWVIERMGRRHKSLEPGMILINPFIDRITRKTTTLEQVAEVEIDAITTDNATMKVKYYIFFKILDAGKALYQAENLNAAVIATGAGVVRAALGRFDFDQVQRERDELNTSVRRDMEIALKGWGIEITRTEIVNIDVDRSTKEAMLQQLNAERERRAAVTKAEGNKKIKELEADSELYAAQKSAEARGLEAEAEANATRLISAAIKEHGVESLQYRVAIKQIEALNNIGKGDGRQTMLIPLSAMESFTNAFKMFKGS